MKRNKLFLLGLFVVFAAVLSLSLVSSTFAKYTSEGTASDAARVAKWGVEITAQASATNTMFEKEYAKDDDTFTLAANTVVSTAEVLAPGTEGTFSAFAVTGTPEVAVRVSYTATLVLTGWEAAGGEYCPLVFTVGTEDYYIGKTGIDTVAQLKDAVEDAIEAKKADYAAGTDLSTVNDDLAIEWAWAFSTSAENDVKDTALGDADTAPTVSLTVACRIDQID